MGTDYFKKVAAETPTRFWINNPTADELELAISAGARNCTTNPAYCARLIRAEPEYLMSVIDSIVRRVADDETAADLVYQEASARMMDRFHDIYEESNGADGYVTIQADPRADEDAGEILSASLRHSRLRPNYMAKIPVTAAGCAAIEELLRLGTPVCATEVFSIAQALHICRLYQRVAAESGNSPVFYVTHITGIFDEYLQRAAKFQRIDIAPDVIRQAGCAVARKQYRLLRDMGCGATMLGGGARGTEHFTEFVGGDMHVTINWSTAQELMESDAPVNSRIDAETPAEVVQELKSKLPDFSLAYEEEALPLERFADYGPVRLFRSNFVEGWYRLLAEIPARRAQLLAW